MRSLATALRYKHTFKRYVMLCTREREASRARYIRARGDYIVEVLLYLEESEAGSTLWLAKVDNIPASQRSNSVK